ERLARRLPYEDTKPSRAAVQLVRYSGKPEVSGSAGIGEPLDCAGSSPQRQVDAQHCGAGGEIDQQIARLQTNPGSQGVLYPLQQVRIRCHPGLGITRNVACREIQGSLMQTAGSNADGELIAIATDERLHQAVIGCVG